MEKIKVIEAYKRGFLSIMECAQLLGIDVDNVRIMVEGKKDVINENILIK